MITTDYKPVKYAGDGIQKQFNVTFKFPRVEDIKCTLKDFLGNVTDLTYNSDYTVTNVNPTGPTYARVDAVVAPAAGTEIFVYAESLFRQETQYKNTGDFNLPVVEKNLDDITLYLQQIEDELSRVVKIDITSDKDPAAIISDIEKQAAEVATNTGKVEQAVTNLFQFKTPKGSVTTAGQLDYVIDFNVDTEQENTLLVLGGIIQEYGTAYIMSNSNTIHFLSDPGTLPYTLYSGLSLANPDLKTVIANYLAQAEQDLETYSNTQVEPQLDAKVAEATAQADRAAGSVLGVGASMFFDAATAPAGWLARWGTLHERTEFPDLWQHVQDQGMVKTEVEWQAEYVANNGTVGSYSSGTTATNFRIPRSQDPIAPYITGAEGSLGAFGSAGLPDIDATFMVPRLGINFGLKTGAFYDIASPNYQIPAGSQTSAVNQGLGFKASLSNPIYGASTTVKTNRSYQLYCVKAYDNVVPVSSADMASMVGDIQTIQNDVTNLQAKDVIIESNKVGYPDWTNVTTLPTTINLVQQAPENGFLYGRITNAGGLFAAACTASGDPINTDETNILLLQSTVSVNEGGFSPIKKGDYFKVTVASGTVYFRFVGVR